MQPSSQPNRELLFPNNYAQVKGPASIGLSWVVSPGPPAKGIECSDYPGLGHMPIPANERWGQLSSHMLTKCREAFVPRRNVRAAKWKDGERRSDRKNWKMTNSNRTCRTSLWVEQLGSRSSLGSELALRAVPPLSLQEALGLAFRLPCWCGTAVPPLSAPWPGLLPPACCCSRGFYHSPSDSFRRKFLVSSYSTQCSCQAPACSPSIQCGHRIQMRPLIGQKQWKPVVLKYL